MRLHDRYLLGEIINPLLISLVAFVQMLALAAVYDVLQLLTAHRLSLPLLAEYILFKVPGMGRFSLPVALLVGSSLAISGALHNSELVAIRVTGLRMRRFLVPIIILGLAFSVGSWVLAEMVAPHTDHHANALYRKLIFEAEVGGLLSDTLFRSGDRVFYFHMSDGTINGKSILRGVVVYELGAETGSSPPRTIPGSLVFWTAEHAEVVGDIWTLTDVIQHDMGPDGQTLDAHPIAPMRIDLHQDIRYFLANQEKPEELTARELRKRIVAYQRLSLPRSVILPLQYEYHARQALPFACLIVALISAPLTIRFGRGGALVGILVSFGVIFFYYDTMMIMQKVVGSGAVWPWLAAWIPNILFGALGVYLVAHET